MMKGGLLGSCLPGRFLCRCLFRGDPCRLRSRSLLSRYAGSFLFGSHSCRLRGCSLFGGDPRGFCFCLTRGLGRLFRGDACRFRFRLTGGLGSLPFGFRSLL